MKNLLYLILLTTISCSVNEEYEMNCFDEFESSKISKLHIINDPTYINPRCDSNKIVAYYRVRKSESKSDSIKVTITKNGVSLPSYSLSKMNSEFKSNRYGQSYHPKGFIEVPIYFNAQNLSLKDTSNISIQITDLNGETFSKDTRIITYNINDTINFLNYEFEDYHIRHEITQRLPGANSPLRKNTKYSFDSELYRSIHFDGDSYIYKFQLQDPVFIDENGNESKFQNSNEVKYKLSKKLDLTECEAKSPYSYNDWKAKVTVPKLGATISFSMTATTDPIIDCYPGYIFYSEIFAKEITCLAKNCNEFDTLEVFKHYIPEHAKTTFVRKEDEIVKDIYRQNITFK